MLNQKDKQWIKELMTAQSRAAAQNLVSLEARLTVSFTTTIHQVVTQVVAKAINNLRIELVEVMQAGFAECATATEMAEVKAHIGSLEQRFTWMQGVMVTKDYLDERMEAHALKEKVVQVQQAKKVVRFVEMLRNKRIVTTGEANIILALPPYPQKARSK